ncbi:MAG: ElaA protein [Chitinophagaceae bacterium]|nr:ElaA protein [Chitinophagaceae bacterium]
MMNLVWTCKKFGDLTPSELYDIIRLRNEVFVVEQNCVFQDADNKDLLCFHLSGYKGSNLVAYTRLVPPGIAYNEASIGRVVTSPAHRKSGYGKRLMEVSITVCEELFGSGPIKIGAQLYLEKFYNSLGFKRVGDIYDEDGIDHIYMIRNGSKKVASSKTGNKKSAKKVS